MMKKTEKCKIGFYFCIFFVFLSVAGCKSGSKKDLVPVPVPKGYAPPPEVTITKVGSNSEPVFSADREWVAYVGRNRLAHQQPQIYVMNLKTLKERRITFQDGEIYDVTFGLSSDRIYYSSSTDELKESLDLVKESLNESVTQTDTVTVPQSSKVKNILSQLLPNTEIYSSALDGHDIERLTQHPGFDGDLSEPIKNQALAYTTYNFEKQTFQIMGLTQTDSAHPNSHRLTQSVLNEESPSYSPDAQKLIWVRFENPINVTQKSTQLIWGDKNAKHEKILVQNGFINIDPSWLQKSDEIIWSSNWPNGLAFNIFSIKLDGSCFRQLTYDTHSNHSPHLSRDGLKLLFSSEQGPQSQISMMDYAPPPCPDTASSLQSTDETKPASPKTSL